ncbi:MAG: hypothetical protein A2493_01030 [Candidatus Magasanikbacteria bacterium RIFOXYC12_FULL_33_11]|uniref:Uncharacterized protein n=1 Tax=Candidatus Magasanikbacteria bacterium RIFOXYC12_FULL_33_11 TaxID=1798701 RepID=A0A1F6NRD4_9BACT|nr:MAG: hypothetical protein A2493_01030 [Candidatus Magasanikbacteria bacterium RIFOXYC12_FULL_33_11]
MVIIDNFNKKCLDLAVCGSLKGDQYMSRSFGARPPSGGNWQIGKTEASVRFVSDAQKFLASCEDETMKNRLQEGIDKVKRGEMVLTEGTSPSDFLQNY